MGATAAAPAERRNGRIYLTGLAFSLLGDSAMSLVSGIWVKSLTGSNSAAALVSVCVYAPSMLGPLAGLVADRIRVRPILVSTNVAAAALVSLLLLVRSEPDVWLIYVVMAGYGLSAVLIDPAESALFTAIFSSEARPRINGLRLTLQESGKLIAPLGGAAIFTAFGGGLVAALDAVTFLIAAAAVMRLRLRIVPREPVSHHWWRDVTAGIQHIRRTRELRLVVTLAAAAMSVSGLLGAAQYDLVDALHRPPSFLGVLTGALGAGSIVAGLLSSRLIARFGELTVVLIGLVDAGVGSLLRATGWTVAALAGSFVLGFALPWVVVAAITLTQRLTPQELQGRVSAALTLALFAPLPMMQAIGAGLITRLDYRALYVATALAQFAIVAATIVSRRPGGAPAGSDRALA
jgi:MFS family permease